MFCRLEFPSVLILYQDIIVSIHGVNVLIGFMDRRLFCTSEDLVETYMSSASPYCTLSGRFSEELSISIINDLSLVTTIIICVELLIPQKLWVDGGGGGELYIIMMNVYYRASV